MNESSNPFREAHKLREAGKLVTEFPGTFKPNVRQLPAGGEHELEDGTNENGHSSKAMKAARFINDAVKGDN